MFEEDTQVIFARGEGLQVAAAAEHLSGSVDQDRADARILVASQGRVIQFLRHFEVQRIGRVRPIQRQVRDAVDYL